MKNFFGTKIFILSTVFTAMLVASCSNSFLDVKPLGALAQAQLTTKAGLENALVGAYSELSGNNFNRLAHPENWVFGGICGGDANKGTDPGDYSSINEIQRYVSQPTNSDIGAVYRAKYEGVSRCNGILTLLKTPAADVSTADVTRITAETKFLRAHFYFELKRIFNNTPYVDETTPEGTIGTVGNTVDLWPKIEADMKFAYDNLPETQGSVGRANKWAAGAYYGKILLYQKKYTDAKAAFDAVIANGKTTGGSKYALLPRYADIFNAANDNNAESIFAVQSAANTGSTNNSNGQDDLNYPYNTGPNGPGNCCGFNQPSQTLVNSFRTDKKGLPLVDESYNSPDNAVKSDQGLISTAPFTPDAGNLDPRLDHSVGRRGIPYLDWQDHPGADWIRNQANGGAYSPKKFVYYKSQEGTLSDGTSWTRGYATMNYEIIRLADVLLMAAECEIEVGSVDKARTYVNQVRTRAANASSWVLKNGKPAANYVIGVYDTPWADKAAARTAVYFERKIELSNEGHRLFDLVRWGNAATQLNAYLANESKILSGTLGGATFKTGKNEYQPIPQNQIDLQGATVLIQNPGY